MMWTNNHFFLKLCQSKNWIILLPLFLYFITPSSCHQVYRRQTVDDILSEQFTGSAQYPENRPISKQDPSVQELQNPVRDPTVVGELQNSARAANSYPSLTRTVETNFTCRGLGGPGWYADVETGCQQYHRCYSEVRGTSFICPPGTLFSQDTLICDYWYNVNCSASPSLFEYANSRLYRPGVPLHGNGTYKSPPATEAPPRAPRFTFAPRPVTQRIARPIVQPGIRFVVQPAPAAFVRQIFTPAPFRVTSAPFRAVPVVPAVVQQPIIFTPPATSPQQLTQNGFIIPGASGRVFEFDDTPEGLTNASSMVSSALQQNFTVGQTNLGNGVRIIIVRIPTIVYINGTIPVSQAGIGSIAVSQINQRFSPDQIALLESQAVAGITYPNFTSSIRTNFTCANLPRPAWYEELQTSCQQYYYCDETGTLTTFLCPATNVFSQATLRCEAWYNAVCGSRPVVDVSNALSLVSGSTGITSTNGGLISNFNNVNVNGNSANVGPVFVTGIVSQGGQDLSRNSQVLSQADLSDANANQLEDTEVETVVPFQPIRQPGPVVLITPQRNGFVQASQESGPVVTAAPRPVFVPQQRPVVRLVPTTRRATTTTTEAFEVIVEEEEVTEAPTTRRTTARRRNVIASIPLTSVFVGTNANRSNGVITNNVLSVVPVVIVPATTMTTRRRTTPTTTTTTTTEAPTTPAPILVPVVLVPVTEEPLEVVKLTEVPIIIVPQINTTLIPIIASFNSITNQSAIMQQLLQNTGADADEANGTNISVITNRPGSRLQVGANGSPPRTVFSPNGAPSQILNRTLAAGQSASVDIPANVQDVTLVIVNSDGTNTTTNLNTEDGSQQVITEETTTSTSVIVPLIVPAVPVTQITPRPIGQVSPRIVVGNAGGLLAGGLTSTVRPRVTWYRPQVTDVVLIAARGTTRRSPVTASTSTATTEEEIIEEVEVVPAVVPVVPVVTSSGNTNGTVAAGSAIVRVTSFDLKNNGLNGVNTAAPVRQVTGVPNILIVPVAVSSNTRPTVPVTTTSTRRTTPTPTRTTTRTTTRSTTTAEEEIIEEIEVVPAVMPVVTSRGNTNGTVAAGSAIVRVTSFDLSSNGLNGINQGLVINNNTISTNGDLSSEPQSDGLTSDDILLINNANITGEQSISNVPQNTFLVIPEPILVGGASQVAVAPSANNATIFVGGATSLNSNFNSQTGQSIFNSSAIAVSINNGVIASTRPTVAPNTARRGRVTWWVPSVVGGGTAAPTTRVRTTPTPVPSILLVPVVAVASNTRPTVPATTTSTTRTTPTTRTTTTTPRTTTTTTTPAPVVVPLVQVIPVNVVQSPINTDEGTEADNGQSVSVIPLFAQEQGALVAFGQGGSGVRRPAAIVVPSATAQNTQNEASIGSSGQSLVPLFGEERGALLGFGALYGASSAGSVQRTTLTNTSLDGLKTPPMVATILLPAPVFSESNLMPLSPDGILIASQSTTPAPGGNVTELGPIIGTKKYLEHRLIVRIGPFRDVTNNATVVLPSNVTAVNVLAGTVAPSVPRQFRQLRRLQ